MIGTASSLRPIRCSEASSIRPTGSPSSRQPSSNENTFSRERSAAISAIAKHRDQPHDLLPDALERRVLAARDTRLWRRQVADRQVGDLPRPDRRQAHIGIGEPELGQTGAGVDRERLGDLPLDRVARRERADHLKAGWLLARRRTASTAPATAVSQAGSARAGSRSHRNETAAS